LPAWWPWAEGVTVMVLMSLASMIVFS